ncbi:hypothetical protein [Candidatus Accumulibacter aalborgensis]|uniref:hypothetical protein n=1 Tax=Candidatus Accumulibacter aalborgensis TaxID=1860102 RepID=UPI001FE18265|nr:hypothetical protein [Candidatus Accumulibacter aalborgensis]
MRAPTACLADRFGGRLGFLGLALAYSILVIACLASLADEGELTMGRNPLPNLIKTAGEFARPSFLDVWFGQQHLEYHSDDGTLLRVENRPEVELDYLAGVGRATWTTVRIATLGSLLGALLALPFSGHGGHRCRAQRRGGASAGILQRRLAGCAATVRFQPPLPVGVQHP